MDERKKGLAISFWTSIAGLVPAGFVVLAFVVWGRDETVAWAMLAAVPVFVSLEISSITAGLSEHESRSGKAALGISITAIVLAVGTAYLRPMRDILSSPFAPALLSAAPITGIIAGATAIDVKNRRTRILKPMLIILFIAFVLTAWPLTQLVLGNERLPIALFSLLLGPWALRITGVGNLHDAKYVSEMTLLLGLCLTIGLVVVSIMTVKAKRPRRAAVLLIFYASLLVCWFGIGATELIVWAREFF